MVHQISRFIKKKFSIVILGFDDQLNRFFPDFLCNFVDARAEQSARIGALSRLPLSLLYYRLQAVQGKQVVGFVKTGVGAGMTYRSRWNSFNKKRIVVAVRKYLHAREKISRSF